MGGNIAGDPRRFRRKRIQRGRRSYIARFDRLVPRLARRKNRDYYCSNRLDGKILRDIYVLYCSMRSPCAPPYRVQQVHHPRSVFSGTRCEAAARGSFLLVNLARYSSDPLLAGGLYYLCLAGLQPWCTSDSINNGVLITMT
jgi:hypothetical protein